MRDCRGGERSESSGEATPTDTGGTVLFALVGVGLMASEPADRGGVSEPEPPARAFLEEYWDWVAVALFLLVTVDMLTTMFAAAALGPGAEANPLVRWALGRGTPALVAVNVLAVVLAVGFFYALREMLGRTPSPYRRPFSLLVEAWLGLLVFVGLGVLANNLSVVFLGASLV